VAALGEGGFGSVWIAHDRTANEEVALKILHPRLINCRVGTKGPTIADRFLAEARILQRLAHPGCVQIKGVIDNVPQKVVAYAMERLVGRDLADCQQSFDLATILKVYARVADILAFLHDEDVIHRDVKAENIFITEPGDHTDALREVKLLDFGVAKEMHANAVLANTATGHLLGSAAAMPPESFSRWDPTAAVEITPAIDQWSMGVGLYHSVSGKRPFEDPTLVGLVQKIERDPPAPLDMLARFGLTEVPPALEAIILRCLEKRPADRFADMRIVAKALREAGSNDYLSNETICDADLVELIDLGNNVSQAMQASTSRSEEEPTLAPAMPDRPNISESRSPQFMAIPAASTDVSTVKPGGGGVVHDEVTVPPMTAELSLPPSDEDVGLGIGDATMLRAPPEALPLENIVPVADPTTPSEIPASLSIDAPTALSEPPPELMDALGLPQPLGSDSISPLMPAEPSTARAVNGLADPPAHSNAAVQPTAAAQPSALAEPIAARRAEAPPRRGPPSGEVRPPSGMGQWVPPSQPDVTPPNSPPVSPLPRPPPSNRNVLLIGLVVAVAIGFVVGWLAHAGS